MRRLQRPLRRLQRPLRRIQRPLRRLQSPLRRIQKFKKYLKILLNVPNDILNGLI